jgi:tetratricopeptide (TPR) repeat protein
MAAGDQEGAMAWLRKARAEIVPTESSTELWVALGNLAMLVSDRTERDALFAEERAQLERTLGADHTFTLSTRVRSALFLENPLEGSAQLREACTTLRELHPQARAAMVDCHYNLGWLAVERGDVVEAKQAFTTVVATKLEPDRLAIAQAELVRLDGDPGTAAVQAEAIARKIETSKNWFGRWPAADAWLVVAAASQTLGKPSDAIAALEAARTLLVEARRHSNATRIMRRYVRVVALLAIAKRDSVLADEARAWYRAAGGYEDAIRALTW